MIKVTTNFEVEYTEDFNNQMNNFAVAIGDSLEGLAPLEKYYALKHVCEKLEGLVSIYIAFGMFRMKEASSGSLADNNSDNVTQND
jgi:hypothetical protein